MLTTGRGRSMCLLFVVADDSQTYHVRVVGHRSVLFGIHLQFEENGQVDDVRVVQAQLSLQHVPVPVDAALRRIIQTYHNLHIKSNGPQAFTADEFITFFDMTGSEGGTFHRGSSRGNPQGVLLVRVRRLVTLHDVN